MAEPTVLLVDPAVGAVIVAVQLAMAGATAYLFLEAKRQGERLAALEAVDARNEKLYALFERLDPRQPRRGRESRGRKED